METINLMFKLGVVYAIFGFIWGIIQIAYILLRGISKRNIGEAYMIKVLKYFFLVDVTFLFTMDNQGVNVQLLVTTGLVLLAFLIGKLQNQQKKMVMFKMVANGNQFAANHFNLKAEIGTIIFALALFTLFIFYPQFAQNPISIWFHESITGIEKTPVFGFIFKFIGIFYLVSILRNLINSILFILSGKAFTKTETDPNSTERNENEFDDFEEID